MLNHFFNLLTDCRTITSVYSSPHSWVANRSCAIRLQIRQGGDTTIVPRSLRGLQISPRMKKSSLSLFSLPWNTPTPAGICGNLSTRPLHEWWKCRWLTARKWNRAQKKECTFYIFAKPLITMMCSCAACIRKFLTQTRLQSSIVAPRPPVTPP